MHKFKVDNYIFEVSSNINDCFTVLSYPKEYSVTFESIKKFDSNDYLIIDKNIYDLYGYCSKNTLVIDPSEEIKTADMSLQICDFLLEKKFSKSDTLHVVGGGVIQDLSAFTAKIFKRGIKWVFYPTTLLSQCDSCIGGKTALNHHNFKNQIALFSSPEKVIIDLSFLSSLPQRELISGQGEIIKLFITGGSYFVNNFNTFSMKDKIKNSLLIKKSIIEVDEFESNLRKVLNYGHTFGHIIESLSKYNILHGEAVILGIYIINKMFDENKEIEKFVEENIDISLIKDFDPLEVYKNISSDKKVFNNKINFVNSPEPGLSEFIPTEINDHLKDKICEIFTY
jgi:3-dehydroquinate synthase